MIRIEHLSKHYGERVVVNDLNLHVEAGQVYALLGPNGAGKSTTIGCLLGFVKPDAGRIALAGSPLMPAEAAIRYAAYIAENVALYDRLTGVENVDFFMRLLGRQLKTGEIEAQLERVDLPRHAWHRQAHGYSKGMRQKVGIVMALAKGARVLVLDEPTSGLDPEASVSFGNLIRTVADDGAAVIMATHDLLRAQELADRCGVLVGGHLVSEWKLRDLGAGELERNYLDSLAARVSANA